MATGAPSVVLARNSNLPFSGDSVSQIPSPKVSGEEAVGVGDVGPEPLERDVEQGPRD